MDRALVDMAEAAWRRTLWRRNRSSSLVYKLISWLTDYGLGFSRVAVTAALIVIAFSIFFYASDVHASPEDSLLISARYFLGLEDHYSATDIWLSLTGIVEAILGLVVLAVVIAIFTSKFTDL
jgi:hypothetical protein